MGELYLALRIKLTEDDVDIIHIDEGTHIRFNSLEGDEIVWLENDGRLLKDQILGDAAIIEKLIETANMDCYEKDERIRRDFAIKLLQEKL